MLATAAVGAGECLGNVVAKAYEGAVSTNDQGEVSRGGNYKRRLCWPTIR